MSNYLKIVEQAKTEKAEKPAPCIPPCRQTPTCDKSDRSDKRVSRSHPNFTPLTVSEALAEINRWGSGAGRNAELYCNGELSEERAVEYVTCAILHRRGESFEVWKHHAPAVRKALTLCMHEMPSEECKVCNGYVRRS